MENNYYKVDALSFSSLSRLAKHPSAFKTKSKPGRHFDKGSAVDILLTEGIKSFEEQVYVHKDDFPTGKVLLLANTVFSKYEESTIVAKDIRDFATNEYCLTVMDEIDFYSKMKDVEARIKKFDLPEFWSYLEMLHIKDKKIVLDNSEYIATKRIVESLRQNTYTKKYCQLTPSADEEIYDQLEVYWVKFGEDMKCKLDRVILNHKDKTIQPIDFKTTGDSTYSFLKSINRFNYNYQASIYLEGINKYFHKLIKDGYKVLDFMFIIETTINEYIGTPRIFIINEEDIKLSAEGGMINGNFKKGWNDLIKDKIWYDEHGYEEHREYIENKAIINVQIYD
tara:strand:+ start:4571 stop:5584 length:1014 start_codon:yes stop_codon:yes gene_type:complete